MLFNSSDNSNMLNFRPGMTNAVKMKQKRFKVCSICNKGIFEKKVINLGIDLHFQFANNKNQKQW